MLVCGQSKKLINSETSLIIDEDIWGNITYERYPIERKELVFPVIARYDITKKIFKDFLVYAPKAYSTPISLSDSEIVAIVNKYYSLGLNKFGKRVDLLLDKKHMSFPAFATYIIFRNGKLVQQIQYQYGSEDNEFHKKKIIQSKKVKEFLDFTLNIVQNKPEIMNAPRSKIGAQ